MRAALRRELLVALRRPALPVGVSVATVLLTAFVVVWRGGLPTLAPLDVYHQTVVVHRVLLLVLLPWVAHRSLAHEPRSALVWFGVLTTIEPGTLLLARVTAMWLVLTAQVVTALPALVLAQQASEVWWALPAIDLGVPLGWAAGVAVVSVAVSVRVRDGLGAWAATTGLTCVVASLAYYASAPAVPTGMGVAACAAVVGVGLWMSSARWTAWQGSRHVA
jgi:hypothetical protein